MEPETVKVVDADVEGGSRIINKSDLQEGDVVINASEGLGIASLREALTAKGVAFEDGAKKAELQALLDAAP